MCLLLASSSLAQMATGTYIGDGTDLRAITGLGFEPHIVLVKSADRSPMVLTTDAMGDGWSKTLGGNDAAYSNDFSSLDLDGFTIRTSDRVNKTDQRFDWVAFARDDGRVATGSYMGTGLSGHLLDLGFRPEYVIVLPLLSGQAVQRNAFMPDGKSLPFDDKGFLDNRITSLTDQGFVLGDDNGVNESAQQYHYVAWRADSARTVAGTYVGNATDNRDITGIGLKPSWVLTKSEKRKFGFHLSSSLAGSGLSQFFSNKKNKQDGVQQLLADGFQLGRRLEVNASNKKFYWMAFGALADLSIDLVANRDTAHVGDQVVLTTTVTNAGPDPASLVQISSLLDPGYVYVESYATNGNYDFLTGIWELQRLPMGQSAVLSITTTIADGSAGQDLLATLELTNLDGNDRNPGNNQQSISVTVPRTADLSIAGSADDPRPAAGQILVLTLTADNAGSDSATNVVSNVTLPAGLTYISHNQTQGTFNPLDGNWSVGTLGALAEAQLNVTVRVSVGLAGGILSTAITIDSDTFDPDWGNNYTTIDVIVASTDLELTKIVDNLTPDPGGTVVFTISLANHGPDPATTITVIDMLPDGLTFIEAMPSQGTYNSSDGTWNVGAMNVAANATLLITAQVGSGIGGAITNTATVGGMLPLDPNLSNNQDDATITIVGSDLAVAAAVDDPTPDAGGQINLSFNIENLGPLDASGLTADVSLPAGLSFVSASPDVGSFDDASGLWTVGSLLQGGTGTLQVVADVDLGTAGQTLSSSVSVGSLDQTDFNNTNDTATTSVVVTEIQLSLIKSVDNPAPSQGSQVIYTLLVTNNGPDTATNVAVGDTLPAGLTYISDVAERGTYNLSTGIWDVGTIALDETAQLELIVSVDVDVGGGDSVVNHAWIIAADQEDLVPGDDHDSAALTLASADLHLTAVVDEASPAAGDWVQYTITLRNDGPGEVLDVVVRDTLVAGLAYQSHDPAGPDYDPVTGLWNVGDLALDESKVLILNARVDDDRSGAELMTVPTITQSNLADPDGTDNSVRVFLSVLAADLQLSWLSVTDPTIGDTVAARLILADVGPDVLESATVAITSSPGLTMLQTTPSAGVFDLGLWNLSAVDSGSEVTLDLLMIVESGTIGSTLWLDAETATARPGDPTPDTVPTKLQFIVRGADLVLDKTANVTQTHAGESILYTLTVRNDGPDPTTGVVVLDTLPANLTYMTHTPNWAVFDAVDGRWQVGDLDVGESASLFLQAQVGDVNPGDVILNQALAEESALADGDPVSDQASVDVFVPAADLVQTLVANVPQASIGEDVVFTATMTNIGPSDASGLVVELPLPPGLEFVSTGSTDYDAVAGTWVIGNLPAMMSSLLDLTVRVSAEAAGDTLHVTTDVLGVDQGDPVPLNNSATLSLPILPDADLGLELVTGSNWVDVGDTLVWTVTLSNAGPSASSNVEVRDVLPNGMTVVDWSAEAGSYDPLNHLWLVSELEPGQSRDLALMVVVPTGSGGSDLQGTVQIETAAIPDHNDINNQGTETVHVTGADLSLESWVDLSAPGEGDDVIMTFAVANLGPDVATGVAMVDSLPAGLTYVSHTPPAEDFVMVSEGVWSWNVGTVEAQTPRVLFLRTRVDAGTTGSSLRHVATMKAGPEEDPNPGNDTAVNLLAVSGTDLTLDLVIDNPEPAENDTVTAVLTLTNVGPLAATGVVVTDAHDAGLVFVDADPSGFYEPATSRWTIEALAAGESTEIRLHLLIGERTGGLDLQISAEVISSDQVDPTPEDAAAMSAVSVSIPGEGLILVSGQPLAAGVAHPLGMPVDVLALQLVNWSVRTDTLTTLTVHDISSHEQVWQGLGVWVEQHDEWLPLQTELFTVESGVAVMGDLNLVFGPGDTLQLAVRGTVSPTVADGTQLGVRLETADDFEFTSEVVVETSAWPLATPAQVVVDGFVAAQAHIAPVPAGVLAPGESDRTVLRVTLPPDGNSGAVLNEIQLTNLGTARPIVDLSSVNIWLDDGDGTRLDDWVGEAVWTGDRWRLSGLDLVVLAQGVALFVTVDTAVEAEGQRSVQMSIPVNGVDMSSGNDGPLDGPLVNPFTMVIGGTDRLYLAAVSRPWVSVRPDGSEEMLLHLTATNTFEADRVVTSLRLTGSIVSAWTDDQSVLDRVVGQLLLHSGSGGELIGVSPLVAGEALFGGLNWSVPSAETRHLVIKAQLSPSLAADGDMISLSVASAVDVQLSDHGEVAGNWPLDGGGGLIVDGFLAGRIEARPGVTRMVGPGAVNQLVMDAVIPGNGHAADVLNSLTIRNQGTAAREDLGGVRLWRDGGNGTFDAGHAPSGDDVVLAFLTPAFDTWSVSGLDLPVPAEGAHLYLSVDVSAAARDSASVELSIPVGGLEYSSANDGPLDTAVAVGNILVVGRSALLTGLTLAATDLVVDQDVLLTMSVSNNSILPVTAVAPLELDLAGDGAVTVLSGPVPASMDLDPGEQVEFTWVMRATGEGQARIVASVSGLNPDLNPVTSLPLAAPTLNIVLPAAELLLTVLSQLPFAVNAGQADINALTLNLSHPGAIGTASVLLDSLTIHLEDETGGLLDFGMILSRVVLRIDGVLMSVRDIGPAMGPFLTLVPSSAPLVAPSGVSVLSLGVEISESAPSVQFRIVVENGGLSAHDSVAGDQVGVVLTDAEYPVASEFTRIVDGAPALIVQAAPGPPDQASFGQMGVRLGVLQMINPGEVDSGAGLQMGVLSLTLVDGAGNELATPATWLSALTVRRDGVALATSTVMNGAPALVSLTLETPLSIAAGSTEDLTLFADLHPESPTGLLGIGIFSSGDWDVRDANSSVPVTVELETLPLLLPPVTIVTPAELVHLGGRASGSPVLTSGAQDQSILELDIRHPGSIGIAGVDVDSLTLICHDEGHELLSPDSVFERLTVWLAGAVVGTVVVHGDVDGRINLDLTGVVCEPGESVLLDVRVDIRSEVLVDAFALSVDVTDLQVTDVHLGTPVLLTPDSGVALPLSSGTRLIRIAADELVLAARDMMPAAIAAFHTDVLVLELDFTSTAPEAAGDLLVTELNLVAVGSAKNSSVLGSLVSGLVVMDGENEWGRNDHLVAGDTVATIISTVGLQVEPGETKTLRVLLQLAAGARTGSIAIGLDLDDVTVRQPEGELITVHVSPALGQIFPFMTMPGTVSPASLEQSYSNFPNPFAAGREGTTFVFGLPAPAKVDLRIYSPRGELVRVLLAGENRAVGLHQDVVWDGRNGRGDVVRNGVLIAELIVRPDGGGATTLRRKVAVVR